MDEVTDSSLPPPPRTSWLLLCLALSTAGCLPSSCTRHESRAISPQDSLSRRLAAVAPTDTLERIWEATGDVDNVLAFPRTVALTASAIYVGDTGSSSVFVFSRSGAFVAEHTIPSHPYPYLAGASGDTLFVFSPEAGSIVQLAESVVAPFAMTPAVAQDQDLQYAVVTPAGIFFKWLHHDGGGGIRHVDRHGTIINDYALHGAAWRHAGLLRPWGDSVLSLRGYLPQIDVVRPDGSRDSLHLRGFDSPMLARTRAFVRGATSAPPLLHASAAAFGDFLFVLNIRPGWLRIDVYDASGTINRILIEADPAFNQRFYPTDLAIGTADDGTLDIVVAASEPTPSIRNYRAPSRVP